MLKFLLSLMSLSHFALAWVETAVPHAEVEAVPTQTLTRLRRWTGSSFALQRAWDGVKPEARASALYYFSESHLPTARRVLQTDGSEILHMLGAPGSWGHGFVNEVQQRWRLAQGHETVEDADYSSAAGHFLQIYGPDEHRPLGRIWLNRPPHELSRAEERATELEVIDFAEVQHWRLNQLLVRLEYVKGPKQIAREAIEFLDETLPSAFRALDQLHATRRLNSGEYEEVHAALFNLQNQWGQRHCERQLRVQGYAPVEPPRNGPVAFDSPKG